MKKNFINKKDNFLVLTFGLLPSTLASPEAPLDSFSRGKQQNKTKNSQMKTQILCGVSVSYKKKKKTPQPPQNQKEPNPACSHISGQQNCAWHLAFRVSFYHPRVKNAGSCSSTLKGRRQFALKTSDKNPLIPVQPTITVRHQPRKILRGGRGKNHSSLNLWLLCFCSYFFPLLQGHLSLFGFVILLSRQIKRPGDTQ